jgi:hypothetical protein
MQDGYDEYQMEIPTDVKPVYVMDFWWIEEDFQVEGWSFTYDRLRGLIEGRARFGDGTPTFHREPTFTTAILHVEGDRLETVNSIYILGEPKDEWH